MIALGLQFFDRVSRAVARALTLGTRQTLIILAEVLRIGLADVLIVNGDLFGVTINVDDRTVKAFLTQRPAWYDTALTQTNVGVTRQIQLIR